MPSPTTMLFCYQAMVRQGAGSGMAALHRQAQYGGTIRALLEVVNDDYRKQLGDSPCL